MTPLIRVAAAVVLTLGVCSLLWAALVLASGGNVSLPLAALPVALTFFFLAFRLRREWRESPSLLSWSCDPAGFHVAGVQGVAELVHVWRGPAWVTLALRYQAKPHRLERFVIWKSAVPAPLWSELALRLESGSLRGNRKQNKENP